MWRRLLPLSFAEWRHHRWRHAAALLAVALGVALAASVQIINASALDEFAAGVRSVNGQPDAAIATTRPGGFDETLYFRLLTDTAVAGANPVIEIDTTARPVDRPLPAAPPSAALPLSESGGRVAVRVLGVDPLQVARLAPGLLPRPAADRASGDVADLLAPDRAYLNAAARARLALHDGDRLELQARGGWQRFTVGGSVAAGGAPLVVLDIAAAQAAFQRLGRLSRIDLALQPGTPADAWRAATALPDGARWAQGDEAVQRVSNLSRAYRVNLGVLALVALLVGGFLVYSVVSLSVAQRTAQLALLGVLGLAASDRRRWLLVENGLIGLAGSALGLAGGVALAALALRLLGGDLGGGYFAGGAPSLAWPVWELAACAALGVLAAVAGAWFPARQAERLAPALALKGLGPSGGTAPPAWPGVALLAAGGLLALAPPIAGLSLAAYAAIALLLAGGVVLVPAAVAAIVGRHARVPGVLPLLSLRRAHHARQVASAAVSGVVASLALSIAITVMVSSFRDAVTDWLGSVLPADLYARSAPSAAAAEQAPLSSALLAAAARLPGVARLQVARVVPLSFDPQQPTVALLARPLDLGTGAAASTLPLLGPSEPLPAGEIGVWASEPAAALHGWKPGDRVLLPLPGTPLQARVRGIWRDYARPAGALAIDLAEYRRATGDEAVNELQLWLAAGAMPGTVADALRALGGADTPLDVASTADLRRITLQIFDRSFAVTVYLQMVAIGVGLVGVAASLSAQVLARRKEFGLLAHLGFTRARVTALVALETGAWLAVGVGVGVLLGLAMALVLVLVVNPQSFHWSMPVRVPVARVGAISLAVLAAGLLTALWSARHAAGRSAVQAVKEDW